jgi:signal transduction histidine kinase
MRPLAAKILARSVFGSLAVTAYLAVVVTAIAAYFFADLSYGADSLIYLALGATSGLIVLVAIARHRPRRRLPWLMIAMGTLLNSGGDAIWNAYDFILQTEVPFPSIADVLYLAGYPFWAAGLAMLVGGLRTARGRATLIDGAVLASGVVLLAFEVLVEPSLAGGWTLTHVVEVAYPAMGLLFVAALGHLLISGVWRVPAFRLLVGAVMCQLAADVVYARTAETYVGGDWVDLGWMLAYGFFGAAALHPSMRDLSDRADRASAMPSRRRLVLLATTALAGPVFIAFEAVAGWKIGGIEAVVSAAVFLLVLTRMGGFVQALESARRSERAARQELTNQNERLVEVDRMKDEFISLVSHELRTPLTSIRGYLELVMDGSAGEVTDEQRAFLAVIDRNSDRLLQLVGDLLFLAQLESGRFSLDPADVDLADLAADSAAAARPAAEAKDVKIELDASPASLRGDRGRLAQVIDNLLSNAVKFTPEGGRVRLGVTVDERVRLVVSDTGMGISAEDQARLFERFFRAEAATTASVSGTGLGLTIVKGIVEAHGGSIGVTSEIGKGTTFVVELPAGAAEQHLVLAA